MPSGAEAEKEEIATAGKTPSSLPSGAEPEKEEIATAGKTPSGLKTLKNFLNKVSKTLEDKYAEMFRANDPQLSTVEALQKEFKKCQKELDDLMAESDVSKFRTQGLELTKKIDHLVNQIEKLNTSQAPTVRMRKKQSTASLPKQPHSKGTLVQLPPEQPFEEKGYTGLTTDARDAIKERFKNSRPNEEEVEVEVEVEKDKDLKNLLQRDLERQKNTTTTPRLGTKEKKE